MEQLVALYLILSAKGTPDVKFAVPHLSMQECKDELKYAFDVAAKINGVTIKGRCGPDVEAQQQQDDGEEVPEADPGQAY